MSLTKFWTKILAWLSVLTFAWNNFWDKWGGYVRTISLWVMIVMAAVSTVLLYLQGQVQWGIFWTGIILWVIGHEVYALLTEGVTISTKYKRFTQKSKKHAFFARLILLMLWIGLSSMVLHLAVW